MFLPLEAIIRSRFGYPGRGIKFKVANGTYGKYLLCLTYIPTYLNTCKHAQRG